MDGYYKFKSTDPNVDEEHRKNFAEVYKWHNYAYTLEPIIKSVTATIRKSGSSRSIIYGFRNNARVAIADAAKACKNCRITFPPQLLHRSIEEKLFGDKYEKYKYLLQFLVARHIKYLGNDITKYDKVFITQLFTILLYLVRMDGNNKGTDRIANRVKPAIQELLDIVITNS
jgi:hypothetical protein